MYLGISLALLLAGGLLAAMLLGLHRFWDRVLGASVLAIAEIIIISLTVGFIPGGYRPLPLTAAVFVVFIVLFAAVWKKGRLRPKDSSDPGRQYIKVYFAVIGVTLPVWLWQLFNGLLLPPVYWDELYYHLLAPAIWARDGLIYFFPTSNPFVAGYPANLELLPGWTMTMTGTDIWADLLGLPFVFVGLAVVMAFCQRLRVRPGHSFWAGLLWVATPVVILHSKSAYIDLPVAVLFGAAAYFLHCYAADGRRAHLVAAAVAMGILAGAKYSALYMVLGGLVPILYRYYRSGRLFPLRLRQVFVLYFGPVLLLGAFFYIKNWIMFGNPVYPMQLQLLGITIFDGQYVTDAFNFTAPENSWLTLVKAILGTEPKLVMDSYYGGFGPQLLLFAIPAAVLFWVNKREQRALFAAAWLVPLFISVAALPAKYPRYLMHLNLFLLPFGAWLLGWLSRKWALLVKALLVVFVAYSLLIATPIRPGPTVSARDYGLAAETVWSVNRVGLGEIAGYRIFSELREIKGAPLRIAANKLRFTYPILGRSWQNQLIFVPPTDADAWLKGILASGADFFVTENPEPIKEEKWIGSNNDKFVLLSSGSALRIYLIIPGNALHQEFVRQLLQEGMGNDV